MIAKNKTIFITGANGFIGRALCDRMIIEGWQVRRSLRTVQHALIPPSAEKTVHISSIDKDTDWSNVLSGVDSIVHLAARVHVMHDVSFDPLSAFRQVNVAGTERLARQAVTAGVRRLIYISSVKVNGEESPISYTEQNTPSPQSPYGISKWEAEQILQQISAVSGLEVVIIRPPLVYGPEVKANFLQLISMVHRGIPLPLAGANNRRSLIYVGNLVDAIITSIVRPEAAGQTYLVSDGEDVSTAELIRRIARALGRPARFFPFPTSIMQLAGKVLGKSATLDRLFGSLTVDTSKICHELDWRAPYTMEQGLQETAEWFKNGFKV